MRERRSDTVLAVVLSVLLHAVPAVLLVLAALWPAAERTAAPGEPMVAAVVDRGALPASMRRALARAPEPLPDALEEPPEPLPEPLPEALPEEETPPPQQLEAQELIVDPDEIAQDEARADSDSPETAEREQEAQQTQGQRDLTERERQLKEEQRIRQTELQRQREQQLADIRRQIEAERKKAEDAERRMRELAERRAREASEAAAQDTAGTPPPGNRGDDVSAAYFEAIAEAIRRNWVRPNEIRGSQVCRIRIRQSAGGMVLEARVEPSCPYDEQGRRSVEAAVLKAQPLPYAGFESAFKRDFILNFRAEDL